MIFIVNKFSKKWKYSDNIVVQILWRECLWLVVNVVEDGVRLVLEGCIGYYIKSKL
jgi:hypothetical protein